MVVAVQAVPARSIAPVVMHQLIQAAAAAGADTIPEPVMPGEVMADQAL